MRKIIYVVLFMIGLMAGCGKNPISSVIGSGSNNVKVGVANMKALSSLFASPVFKANHSSDPESFLVTLTSITLTKEDGSDVILWSGSEEIDVVSLTSLSQCKFFNGGVPAGKYKKITLRPKGKAFKVKGSVILNGTTYYTKTSHSGFASAPAEYEELETMGDVAYEINLSPAIEIKESAPAEIYCLFDTGNYLTYYDGDSSTSLGGFGPRQVSAGMYLKTYLPYAITVGKPVKKEVYYYTTQSWQGKGQLTIFYDGNDNPISGSARPLYVDNGSYDFRLYGWLTEAGGAGQTDSLKKNADGTLTIKLREDDPPYTGYVKFPNFQRASHTGSFVSDGWARGVSGTYTATKVE